MLKNILLFALGILAVISLSTAAMAKTRAQAPLKVTSNAFYYFFTPDRPVFYQEIAPNSAKKKGITLVLLPGLNRSWPAEYSAVSSLSQLGYASLITTTSSHWESLQGLNNNQTPYFLQHPELRTQDFMQETESMINDLKVKNPLLIALSYSSAMANYSHLPVVYVAPLIKAADTNPQAAQAAAAWEATLSLNPFFGKQLIRQFRDSGYRSYWSSTVNQNLSVNDQSYNNLSKQTVIESYVSISRSAEDFDFTKMTFADDQTHLFILGENESQSRLKGQIQTIINATQNGKAKVIFVRHAEHNVPATQPEGFVTALDYLVTSWNELPSGKIVVGVIDPQQDASKLKWLNNQKASDLFKYILALPNLSESADLEAVLGK